MLVMGTYHITGRDGTFASCELLYDCYKQKSKGWVMVVIESHIIYFIFYVIHMGFHFEFFHKNFSTENWTIIEFRFVWIYNGKRNVNIYNTLCITEAFQNAWQLLVSSCWWHLQSIEQGHCWYKGNYYINLFSHTTIVTRLAKSSN